MAEALRIHVRLQQGNFIRTFELEAKPNESVHSFLARLEKHISVVSNQLADIARK